jgi:hypothetical protein
MILTALSIAIGAGCSDQSTAHARGPSTPSHEASVGQPPPTQSELDAQAAREIDESNADAEFEKLRREIEGGG